MGVNGIIRQAMLGGRGNVEAGEFLDAMREFIYDTGYQLRHLELPPLHLCSCLFHIPVFIS
jgi:hypothetical protein